MSLIFWFVIFPLICYLVASLFVILLISLEKLLDNENVVKAWLRKNKNFYDVKWLSNKIDAIFTITLIILMVSVTLYYS